MPCAANRAVCTASAPRPMLALLLSKMRTVSSGCSSAEMRMRLFALDRHPAIISTMTWV